MDPLWDALLQMPGVGTATASKLLARKRPRLCPVSDKVVIGAVGVPGWTWEELRAFLQDPAARAEIEALRPPPAAVVSVLRILDVAIWIRHSHSRAASRIRRDSGIPEPGHSRPLHQARPRMQTRWRSRLNASRPRSGYLADVREIYVLLMIPVDPRVRQPEMQTAAGGCGLRAEAGWCIVPSLDEHPVRTIRTLF